MSAILVTIGLFCLCLKVYFENRNPKDQTESLAYISSIIYGVVCLLLLTGLLIQKFFN